MTSGRHALVPADLPASVRHRRVERGDAVLAVVEVGPSTAPAWVLAHGAGSSARFIAAAFAGPVLAAGGRLVTYDLRGHGASSHARTVTEHHLDVHTADLRAVVASTPGDLAVVGGVSLGGHAAVAAAASGGTWDRSRGPEALLACLPAWTGQRAQGEGPHAVIAAAVREHGIAAHLAGLETDTELPAWLRTALLTDLPRHDPASLGAALVALDGGDAPTPAVLAGLSEPLAVVAWPDDPGHPLDVARRWSDLAPRGALATLRIADMDASVTRLGAAAVTAVRTVAPVVG